MNNLFFVDNWRSHHGRGVRFINSSVQYWKMKIIERIREFLFCTCIVIYDLIAMVCEYQLLTASNLRSFSVRISDIFSQQAGEQWSSRIYRSVDDPHLYQIFPIIFSQNPSARYAGKGVNYLRMCSCTRSNVQLHRCGCSIHYSRNWSQPISECPGFRM